MITEENETVSLAKAVGITAISIYGNMNKLSIINGEDEKFAVLVNEFAHRKFRIM